MPAPLWAAGPMLAMFADWIPGCVPVLPRGPSPAQVAYFRASAALGRSHNLCVGGEGLRRRWESALEIMMLERDGLQELSELWCSRGDPPRPRPHLGHDPTSASVAPRPRLHLGLLGPISASSPPRPRLHLGLAPTSASAPPRPRSLLGLGPTSASATPRPRPHLGLGSTSASAAPRPRLHLVPEISRHFQIFSDIFRYSDISDISRYFQIFLDIYGVQIFSGILDILDIFLDIFGVQIFSYISFRYFFLDIFGSRNGIHFWSLSGSS